MHTITTPSAPIPAGHYSQAVVHNGCVYVAGQLPIVPGQSEHVVGTIEEQTVQVFANVRAVLEAAGSDLSRLLQVTVYVSDMALWGRFNAAYAALMGDHRPARAVVPVNALHYGYHVEVQAIAALHEPAPRP
ncbi:MAG: RidA family protein [Gemmatimonadota bacterium]|nr:RidA family protein [Gemmatimonadota bacterium]